MKKIQNLFLLVGLIVGVSGTAFCAGLTPLQLKSASFDKTPFYQLPKKDKQIAKEMIRIATGIHFGLDGNVDSELSANSKLRTFYDAVKQFAYVDERPELNLFSGFTGPILQPNLSKCVKRTETRPTNSSNQTFHETIITVEDFQQRIHAASSFFEAIKGSTYDGGIYQIENISYQRGCWSYVKMVGAVSLVLAIGSKLFSTFQKK
jgi:hypothetical protein